MKKQEFHEGPEARKKFDEGVSKLFSCPQGEARRKTEEFLKAGEHRVQSEAFEIIRDKHKIGYAQGRPPAQHIPMLGLMSLAAQIKREAGQFLKQDREKLMSPEESVEKMLELKVKEAYWYEQFDRLLES